MMLDLDFKRYNDNFGHSAGAQALAAIGESLLRCVRAEDVACRYSGEEFTLILPECSLRQATVRAAEICKRIREYRVQPDPQAAGALTVSIGVAAFDETTDRVDLLLGFADDALHQAKRAGRDRVVAAAPQPLCPNQISPKRIQPQWPPPKQPSQTSCGDGRPARPSRALLGLAAPFPFSPPLTLHF